MRRKISQTVDRLLADEVRRRYWELWNADNQAAIAAYKERKTVAGIFVIRCGGSGQITHCGAILPTSMNSTVWPST